ncbi:hypothetical protein FBU31_000728 [Coemansia sp. 'formosensis']|nr:hypothetical protein FBU31_000728 [Coemansia sp. 'formosensis']
MDTVRLMIGMFDRDRSGTIGFDEFIGLWRYIDEWKQCFRTFDRDNSGTIDREELNKALNAFGFRVSTPVVDSLIRKYDIQGKLCNIWPALPAIFAGLKLSVHPV